MAAEAGHLKPEWVEELSLADGLDITDPRHILRICLGLAWEAWYLKQLEAIGVVAHPGECHLDGIHMNPDGESVDVIITQEDQETHELIIHEIKLTYKSSRKFTPETQWLYMRQIMGYCKAKDTQYGMLHVVFVCGDYSYPITPDRRVWLLKFDQKELDLSWNQVTEYMDKFDSPEMQRRIQEWRNKK
jgi:hypothetical protein